MLLLWASKRSLFKVVSSVKCGLPGEHVFVTLRSCIDEEGNRNNDLSSSRVQDLNGIGHLITRSTAFSPGMFQDTSNFTSVPVSGHHRFDVSRLFFPPVLHGE